MCVFRGGGYVWMYVKAWKHCFLIFLKMQLRSLKNLKCMWHCWAISHTDWVCTDNHHESSYDSSMCAAHTQKYTNAVFPNDNPFLTLLSTHFHPEIPVVCSIPLFRPLCLSSLSFSLLLSVYFLSSYFHSIPLSLTVLYRSSPVMGVYHPLSIAVCLWLEPTVLSSHHLLWHWYFKDTRDFIPVAIQSRAGLSWTLNN